MRSTVLYIVFFLNWFSSNNISICVSYAVDNCYLNLLSLYRIVINRHSLPWIAYLTFDPWRSRGSRLIHIIVDCWPCLCQYHLSYRSSSLLSTCWPWSGDEDISWRRSDSDLTICRMSFWGHIFNSELITLAIKWPWLRNKPPTNYGSNPCPPNTYHQLNPKYCSKQHSRSSYHQLWLHWQESRKKDNCPKTP